MEQKSIHRLLPLEFVRVTEAAAIASARLMGRGDRDMADQAAVDAMKRMLDTINIEGTIVIGEGERDEAPMLFIGEKVGQYKDTALPPAPSVALATRTVAKVDIAVDPLEGTNLCAKGHYDAICVIAVAESGGFLHAPDTYMNKIAVGSEAANNIDIRQSPRENLRRIADAKKKAIDALTVTILDRDRHRALIEEVRSTGARIKLIDDGDVSAAISTCNPHSGVDVLMGTGGAPEGVLAAAALRCLGGDMQGTLAWRNENEKERALKMGIKDLNKVYLLNDLARGPVIFCVTGVTDGGFCDGVKFLPGDKVTTHSVVMRSQTGTVRDIRATHDLSRKPEL